MFLARSCLVPVRTLAFWAPGWVKFQVMLSCSLGRLCSGLKSSKLGLYGMSRPNGCGTICFSIRLRSGGFSFTFFTPWTILSSSRVGLDPLSTSTCVRMSLGLTWLDWVCFPFLMADRSFCRSLSSLHSIYAMTYMIDHQKIAIAISIDCSKLVTMMS